MVLGLALSAPRSAVGQIVVPGPTIFEREAAAGETYRGAIPVRNTSDVSQVARLSIVDYFTDSDGNTRFEAPGSHPRSSAGWIALSQSEVTVPPQGEVSVEYSVNVAAVAQSPVGTYWSVVIVEREGIAGPAPAGPGVHISLNTRYAVQIVTNIGSTGEPRLALGHAEIDQRVFVVEMTNVGTRAGRPRFRLEVYREDGSPAQALTAERGRLYPSMSTRQTFALTDLTPGTYTFLLLADIGAPTVQGAKYQLQIP